MEMFCWYTGLISGALGTLIVTVAALMAVARSPRMPTLLQGLGALAMLTAVVMNHLPLTHLEGRRIAPAWIWRTEELLSGLGMLVFSIGFCWHWIGHRPAR